MPAKKTYRGGGRRRRPRQRRPVPSPLFKALGAVAVLAVIVLGTLLVARFVSTPETRAVATARRQAPAAPPHLSAKGLKPISLRRNLARSAETETPADLKSQPDDLPKKPSASEPNAADSNSLHAALPPLPPELPPLKNYPGWRSSSTMWVMTVSWPKNSLTSTRPSPSLFCPQPPSGHDRPHRPGPWPGNHAAPADGTHGIPRNQPRNRHPAHLHEPG